MENELIAEALKYIITAVLAYSAAWLRGYFQRQSENKKDIEALKGAMQAFLRDRMLQAYDFYAEKQGWCPHNVKESIANMYKWYNQLGKNGIMGNNIDAIINLPESQEGKDAKQGQIYC